MAKRRRKRKSSNKTTKTAKKQPQKKYSFQTLDDLRVNDLQFLDLITSDNYDDFQVANSIKEIMPTEKVTLTGNTHQDFANFKHAKGLK